MDEDKIIIKIVGLESDMADVKDKLKKLDDIDQLLTGQDKMIGLLQNIHTEMSATNAGMKRHETSIEEHEKRIVRVETHLKLDPLPPAINPNPQFQPI